MIKIPSKIKGRGKNRYQLTVSAGYDGHGKQVVHTKTVEAYSQNEAKKLYNEFAAEVQKGNVATQKKVLLKDFYAYWREHYAMRNLKPKTIFGYDLLFKRIEYGLGHLYLDKIEARHLHSFYKNLEEDGVYKGTRKEQSTLSTVMIQKHHKLLQLLYNKAIKWGFTAYNPCEKVDAPKAKYKRIAIYDQEQTAKMLNFLSKEEIKYQAMILIALTGGIRRGELFGITWKCVNFDNCTIDIEKALLYLPKVGLTVSDLKTSSSYRTVSLPGSTMQILRMHKAEQSFQRAKLGGTLKNNGKWEGQEEQENDFVFTTCTGKPSHPDSLNNWLKKFTVKYSLPHISPHAFRHMNATFLLVSGVDVRTVCGKLGHSKPSTTTDIYSHLLKTAEQKTANVMEEFLQIAAKKV